MYANKERKRGRTDPPTIGAVIRGEEKRERERNEGEIKSGTEHRDCERAERIYEPCGGETKVDKDGGMKRRKTRGDDVHIMMVGKIGRSRERQPRGATRRGGSMLRRSSYTRTHIHICTQYTVSMPRDSVEDR